MQCRIPTTQVVMISDRGMATMALTTVGLLAVRAADVETAVVVTVKVATESPRASTPLHLGHGFRCAPVCRGLRHTLEAFGPRATECAPLPLQRAILGYKQATIFGMATRL